MREYLIPKTVKEAIQYKIEHGEGAVFLGGGTEIGRLNSSVKEFSAYISLEALKLKSIKAQGSSLTIGAMVTIQELMDHTKVPKALLATVKDTLPRPIRNVGTLGGNIASRKKESYFIASLLALQSTLKLVNLKGIEKEVPLQDYLERNLPGLITSITIPQRDLPLVVSRVGKTLRARPVCTVAGTYKAGESRLFVLGGTPEFLRVKKLEKYLDKGEVPTSDQIEKELAKVLTFEDNILGSKVYKSYITGVTVERLLADLVRGEAK